MSDPALLDAPQAGHVCYWCQQPLKAGATHGEIVNQPDGNMDVVCHVSMLCHAPRSLGFIEALT
jgi:hypothetical protein